MGLWVKEQDGTGRCAGSHTRLFYRSASECGERPPTAMMNEQMQEMEEVSKELLKLLAAGGAGNLLKRSLDKQETMFDKLLDTQLTAAQLVKDLLATEETVAQKLLAGEEELQSSLQTVRATEEALRRARADDASLRADSRYPSCREPRLAQLLPAARQTQRAQPQARASPRAAASHRYIAQLYYKISRIDWDYECEHPHIKGIHHGPAIAQPISLDSSQLSRCFISDYLWSLVDTAW
ncbi:hypothetical protein KIL84_020891 [Mauremys mutica]|uniref:Kinetochore protein Spc24 n=1 Tax=Mauremys mutica TaxID=74926 RepID=A0A9D4ATX3_9SAUR|nr:hypothetical protein KIL84_020891 [Mauremys mutica]